MGMKMELQLQILEVFGILLLKKNYVEHVMDLLYLRAIKIFTLNVLLNFRLKHDVDI